MSPKASSDFGLYKEKQKENNLKSIKFVLVVVVTVLFLLVILYTLVHMINNHSHTENLESTIEKPAPKAEKLVSSENVKREMFQSKTPKPFGVTYRGLPPSQFTSTTEKVTTLNYPQLSSFRHRYYPNNIQDIIKYANRFSRPLQEDFVVKYVKNYKQSPSQNVPQNKRITNNFTFNDNDPFYLFKPQDPGDINLLATASFRFAPPAWSNLRTKIPRGYTQENIKRQEIYNRPKPVSLTLNIYPNKENELRAEHRYGRKQLANHRIVNLQPGIRFPESKPKNMVIHLNLFPDDGNGSESQVNNVHIQTTPSTT